MSTHVSTHRPLPCALLADGSFQCMATHPNEEITDDISRPEPAIDLSSLESLGEVRFLGWFGE